MFCFLVKRLDELDFNQDKEMVVVAEDTEDATRMAREASVDFAKAELEVKQVEMSERQVVLIAETGL